MLYLILLRSLLRRESKIVVLIVLVEKPPRDYNLFRFNPSGTDLFNLNFQSLEIVSRYRDPQLQVTENLGDLWNSSSIIYHVSRFKNILF